ncbi:hypothetical protein D3C78_1656450 [compost metagenome]
MLIGQLVSVIVKRVAPAVAPAPDKKADFWILPSATLASLWTSQAVSVTLPVNLMVPSAACTTETEPANRAKAINFLFIIISRPW